MPNAIDDLQVAVQHFQAGRLAEAEEICRQLLVEDPTQADAWCYLGASCQGQGKLEEAEGNYRQALQLVPTCGPARNNLGILLAQRGRLEEAAHCFAQAVHDQPADADAHNNLALVRAHQGRLAEAAAGYQRALQLRPDFPAARSNLDLLLKTQASAPSPARAPELQPPSRPNNAALLHLQQGLGLAQQGRLDEAKTQFQQALELDPSLVDARNNLGCIHFIQGRCAEAVGCYEAVLRDAPEHVDAHSNLGAALVMQGHAEQAVSHCREAIRLRPDLAAAHTHLGNALRDLGQTEEADRCYEQALRIHPDDPSVQANYAGVLQRRGKLDEAVAHFRKALQLKPGLADAHNNLGNVLRDQMLTSEALDCIRRAMELVPQSAAFHSNLLYTLNFDSSVEPATIFAEHQQWARQHADSMGRVELSALDRAPDRRLRIGYVVADFCDRAVMSFIEPILESHDRAKFEVICYSLAQQPDATPARLRNHADRWHDTRRLSDDQLTELIGQDRIDILVDLSGHAAHNRLLVFARKPAPIQVAYLGYPNTSGLSAIDYRLTDDYADPPGTTDEFYSERLIRLPKSFFSYRPSTDSPPVSPLPASRNKHVTFGALGDPAKVRPEAIAGWSQILKSVPKSRLILLVADAEGRSDFALEQFRQQGIEPPRLELVGRTPRLESLSLYQRVDVALDTFPCNDHPAVCDALWMGAPVVTLSGKSYASRFGASALVALRMKALVAQTAPQYIKTAVKLASEQKKLAEVRAALRDRFAASPLVNAQGFTRNLEQAYRTMWRDFCSSRKSKR